MANVRYVDVSQPEQMQFEITRLVSAGFTVANQGNRSVTLVKRKEFSIPMLIIGLLLCVVPLFVYLIVYALQKDQIVEIRLIEPQQVTPYRASDHFSVDGEINSTPAVTGAPVVQMTPDGQQWWDGQQWQAVAISYPPYAQRSQDGRQWWDGQAWRPMPGGF